MIPNAHDGVRAAITGVGYATPARLVTSLEVEARITEQSGRLPLPAGTIEAISGIHSRYMVGPGEFASTLGIEAGRIALDDAGVAADAVDLLVFASASHDQIEPATAHIVAEGLGVDAPAFDAKNACNSFINGAEIAEAFIKTGARETGVGRERRDADARHAVEGRLAAGAAPGVHRLHDGRPRHGRRVRGRRRWPGHRLPITTRPRGTGGSSRCRAAARATRSSIPTTTTRKATARALRDAFLEIDDAHLARLFAETGTCWDDYAIVSRPPGRDPVHRGPRRARRGCRWTG